MLFPRFAQFVAALVLIIVGFAAPLHAQNNKPIVSGTWYEDRAASNAASSILTLTFAQTPANQFLNITNVSCNVQVTSAQVISAMSLNAGTTSGSDDLGRTYYIRGSAIPETQGSLKFYSIVTNQIYYKFGPGRYPSIYIDVPSTGSSSTFANCTIVGNLTNN